MTKKMLMKVFAILEMALCTILPASAMEFGPICMYDEGWYMYGHSVGMTESWSKLLIPVENIGKNDVVEPIIIYGSATPDKIASVKVVADSVMKRDVEAAEGGDLWEFNYSFWPYDEPSSSRKWIVVSMKDSKEWSGAYSFRVGLKGTDLYSDEMNIVGFEDAPIKPMDAFGLNITGFQWWGEGYWFESRSDTIILSITVPSAGVLKIDKPFYYRGEDGVKTLKVGGSAVSDVKYGEDLYPYDDYTCVLEDLTITTSGKGIVTLKVTDDCYFDCANIAFYEGGKESVCISAWAEGGQIHQDNEYSSGYAGYTRGYVTGGGTFAKGSRVTLTAVPGNGEVFDRWVQLDDYGNEISTVALSEAQLTSPTLSFVVTDSMVGSVKDYKKLNFFATWKEKYDVMGITSPIGAGAISGGGSYVPGSAFVLSVKDLNSLSTFKCWEDNSVTSPVRSIVSEDQDVIYIAIYGSLPRLTINCEEGGSVVGGGIFPAGKTVTLKATANKGYVFAGWFTADGEPVSGASDHRSPSYSYVTTGDDVTLVAKFIPIADDVADISFTMYDEYKLGMAIEPVLINVSGCTSLPTVKVSGLPAGLKFTAKPIYKKGSKTEVEVPANTIYGAPTKSGVYTVVATVTTAGKKTATCSQTVIVRKEGEKVVLAECDATGGKVTGGGVYATGKNVALKATANKEYVFAGWYYSRTDVSAVQDVNAQAARSTGLIPCDSTLVDYRNPSYSYVMGADDKTFYAHFEPVAADTNLNLTVDGIAISPADSPLRTFMLSGATNLIFAIDSLSLPKASVKGLPGGMKFTEKPIFVKGSKTEIETPANSIYGTLTKPGVYKVSVSLTNTSIKKAVVNEFAIVVPNLTDGMIQVVDEYGPYVPGVAYTNTIVAAAGCTVSGLPAGMKWTAKDILDSKTKLVAVPANSVYGAPTKPGKYTVYFTKTIDKVKHTATATFIIGDFPVVNVVTVGSGTGKVTGAGAFAANKKGTLKATADTKDDAKMGTKKSVFAGWYYSTTDGSPVDEENLVPVESTVDFRTASLPYVMTAEPETTLYAMFVTAEEDSDIMLYVKDKEITVNAVDNNFVAQGTTILPLEMDSISVPKAAVSGLPAGMKYTDKVLTVKATKTEDAYDVPANAIYGTPTKPGLYTVTVKLTNTTIKKAIEKKFTIEVPNMRSGLYDDSLAYETSSYPLVVGLSDLSRYPAFTIPEGAKVSVSGLPAGMKWDAKNGVLTGIPTKSGTFTMTITTTIGRDKFIDTVTLDVKALPEILVGTYTGLIGRDVYVEEDDPWMAYGMANVTVAANGKITAKMTLPCGTYSFSAAGWDYVEDGVYSAVLQTKNGDEFELVIDSKRNWKEIAEDSALLIDGYKEFRVPIWRNEHVKGGNIESDPVANELISEIKSLKKVAFKVEGSKSSGYEVTEVASNDRSANLTVTFDTKGGVKYAGNFDGVRVSGFTFLCIDDDGYYTICDIVVPVGKTESVYISFGIERDEDGELQFEVDVIRSEFHENNRDCDKVQLWEGGPYWATTNIGAEKPEDYGYYFWWGDTVGYKRENSKWVASDGSNFNFSFDEDNVPTYNKSDAIVQSEGWITAEGILVLEHDAAQAHWGGDWRMPTYQEFDELNSKCDWVWMTRNGVNGYVVRGRGNYVSNSIFLPCAGDGHGTSLYFAGLTGNYWSSDLMFGYGRDAGQIIFGSDGHNVSSLLRFNGLSVRPVQGFTK